MGVVEFEGLDNLRSIEADLNNASGRVGAKAAAVVRKSAADVERIAKQRAPVDTGFLRNSITTDLTGDGRSTRMEAEIGPEASYAPFLEWGTSRMAPQPFMGPAADLVEPKFLAAMKAIADPLEGAR